MLGKIGLASTVFGAAGTDEVLLTDVYTVSEDSTKTSFVSKLDNLGYKAAEYIRTNPTQVQDLISLAKNLRENTGLTTLQKVARVKEMLPAGALSTISKYAETGVGVIEGLAAKVGVSPELVGKVKVIAGGVAGNIMNDVMYGNQINKFDILRDLVNDSSVFEYLNLENEVMLANEIFTSAVGTDMFTTLLDRWEETYDRDVYRYALAYAVPQVVYVGDIDSMKAVINKIGVANFRKQVPNVVQDILTSYRIPYSKTVSEYPALFNDIVSTLRLVVPSFPYVPGTERYSEPAEGETPVLLSGVIDLKPCSNMSDDIKLLCYSYGNVDFRIMAMFGSEYQMTTKESLFTEFYPDAAIGETE